MSYLKIVPFILNSCSLCPSDIIIYDVRCCVISLGSDGLLRVADQHVCRLHSGGSERGLFSAYQRAPYLVRPLRSEASSGRRGERNVYVHPLTQTESHTVRLQLAIDGPYMYGTHAEHYWICLLLVHRPFVISAVDRQVAPLICLQVCMYVSKSDFLPVFLSIGQANMDCHGACVSFN